MNAVAERFVVHFGKRAAFGVITPSQDSLALGGDGLLEISGDSLTLRGQMMAVLLAVPFIPLPVQ